MVANKTHVASAFALGATSVALLRYVWRRHQRRLPAPMPRPSARPAPQALKRGFLTTEHGDLYYQTSGDGPALLFFHGNPRSSDEFTEVSLLLQDRFRCVAVDYFGQGRSGDPMTDDPCSMTVFGDYAMQILDLLGIKDVTVVGSLSGCSVALSLAVRYPSRVHHIVLGIPFYFFEDTLQRSKKYRARLQDWTPDSLGDAALAAWQNFNMRPLSLETNNELWLNYRKTLDTFRAMPFQWQYIQANHDFLEQGKFAEALARLKDRPVLLIWSPRFLNLLTRFGLRGNAAREFVETRLRNGQAKLTIRDSRGPRDTGLGEAIFGEDARNIATWIGELHAQ